MKTMKALLAMGAGLLTLAQGVAFALDKQEPALLPAQGIYGLPGKGSDGALTAALPPHISADFLTAIGYMSGAPTGAIHWFQSEAKRVFPTSVIATVTPQVKHRTYALSLQITRADTYSVPSRMNATVDVYLPLAVNIFFTNILTGEVLYSTSRTKYTVYTTSQANYDSGQYKGPVQQAYRDALKELTTAALEQAVREFKPLRMTAKVLDEWKGYYVLDKGMDGGIATGNELVNASGAGLKIINAGRSYAVGIPTLGDIHKGDELSFFSTVAAADVRKPRVLILDGGTQEDYSGAYAATQFSESLGTRASFTILPVNPDFQAVLNDIASNQGLKQAEVTQKRALPNYFLRFKVLRPLVYELPSNRNYGRAQVFDVSGFAELVDQSGRVVYATSAQTDITDTLVEGGKSFDQADRKKILYGNLLKSLSDRFVQNVRFSRSELFVQKTDGDKVVVSDQAGLLAPGQNAKIYRQVSVKGIAEPVLVPIWDAQVKERQGNDIRLELLLPMLESGKPVAVNEKDVLAVNSAGNTTSSRLAFSLCDTVADIGTLHLPSHSMTEEKDSDLKDITYFSLGEHFKQPFFVGHYIVGAGGKPLAEALANFTYAGFSKPVSVPVSQTSLCIKPLLKVVETSRKCAAGAPTCDLGINVTTGIQILQGDKKGPTKLFGMNAEINQAPAKDVDAFEARKVFLKTIELMPKAISTIDVSPL